MTALRWGILGTGHIAHAFAADLQFAGREIVAVGSRSAESAEAFAAELAAGSAPGSGVPRAHSSYEQLAADEDVDIVYVATPHPFHAAHAAMVLEQDTHVLVEKPFTLHAAEAAGLRDLARSRGLLAMEAMWTRYLPHMVRIREIIASGGLGEIRMLSADHAQSLPTDPGHRINALPLGGGALLDLGIYPLSFAADILGPVEQVSAQARFGDTGADTEVATVMHHHGGALSTSLSSSRAAGQNTAHILGTEGRIDIDGVWFADTSFTHTGADGTVHERFAVRGEGRGMQHQALAAEAAVADGTCEGSALGLDETVAIMELLDTIREQIGLRYPGEDQSG
ncbi:Gfo/Idh/MocA family protein [Nesterenkonia sp. F]|uniref:Gfo/Idh/MocA family protein n=1 Tax=Nesterenkonia sp. F TaxID=795955 RepID=UPI000255D31A|nr:Gfo/Idh/MocA family oxidoreductase [Nesterenkonia sp. F]